METLVTEDTLDKAAALFKAFAHHDRLQIVNVLINGEFHVGELKSCWAQTNPIHLCNSVFLSLPVY